MKGILTKRTCGLFITACLAFFLTAFSGAPDDIVISADETRKDGPVIGKGGPPPWAPAHGNRAKYRYCYYPAGCVYQDVGRGVYFYRESGQWKVSVKLPAAISVDFGDSVVLEMDTSEPYRYHQDVIEYYPPGKTKGKKMKKS
jgi:hypothetical protein